MADVDDTSMPIHSCHPKIILSANAVPITSGTSLATMASSVTAHMAMRVGVCGNSSRTHLARSLPVASARRTASSCTKNPSSVVHTSTHSSWYPNSAPATRSLSKFPGSTYAMDMRNPGPVNAQHCLQLNFPFWKSSVDVSMCMRGSAVKSCDDEFLWFAEMSGAFSYEAFMRQSRIDDDEGGGME